MTTMQDLDDVKDFSYARNRIPFRIGDDVFYAAPDLPSEVAMDFAAKSELLQKEDTTAESRKEIMRDLFRMVLFPESAARFIERLGSTEKPIGVGKVKEITEWLFGEYGLRPTESDSASSLGSESQDDGTSSTETTSPEGSTSESSPSTDSSTSSTEPSLP